jgi:hypothetical protein
LGEDEIEDGELQYMDNGEVVDVQKKDDKKDESNSSFENECIIY